MSAHAARAAGLFVCAALVLGGPATPPARADNAMGYRLLPAQEASNLPRNGGSAGLDVERAEQISDAGMVFDLMRVRRVRDGSGGQRAGFRAGDEIIAVDGRVFPTLASFAAFIGSMPPGTQTSVDYIPAGAGPGQAQRVALTIGAPNAGGTSSAGVPAASESTGLSTGQKIAIGVGAAALLGCYELGCFSHRHPTAPVVPNGSAPPLRQ